MVVGLVHIQQETFEGLILSNWHKDFLEMLFRSPLAFLTVRTYLYQELSKATSRTRIFIWEGDWKWGLVKLTFVASIPHSLLILTPAMTTLTFKTERGLLPNCYQILWPDKFGYNCPLSNSLILALQIISKCYLDTAGNYNQLNDLTGQEKEMEKLVIFQFHFLLSTSALILVKKEKHSYSRERRKLLWGYTSRK